MHVVAVGQQSVGPHAGIVYAGLPEIYPIVAKFSWLMTDPEAEGHPDKTTPELMWRELQYRLKERLITIMRRFPFGESSFVAVDYAANPLHERKRGRVTFTVAVEPSAVCEIYVGRFTLWREVVNSRPTMMIEYHADPASSDPLS